MNFHKFLDFNLEKIALDPISYKVFVRVLLRNKVAVRMQ